MNVPLGKLGVRSHRLTEREAALYIGMSVAFLQQERMRRRGPVYLRIGRSVRYDTSDLDSWCVDRRVTHEAPASRRTSGEPTAECLRAIGEDDEPAAEVSYGGASDE